MVKNFSDCTGFQDGRDDFQGSTAMRAVFDVDIEHPLEQTRPTDAHRNRRRRHIFIPIGYMTFVLLVARNDLRNHVDLTNLQRQIIHTADAIGLPKTISAQKMLYQINPEIEVLPLQGQVTEDMLLRLILCDDAVVDASDNFATRHALNQACILHKKLAHFGRCHTLRWESFGI